jgi:hypothetical protein
MGALCNSESKQKQIIAKPHERKEQIKLQIKGGTARKSGGITDIEEKLDLIFNQPAGEEIEELKLILKSGKLNLTSYLEKEDNETLLTKAIRKNAKPEVIELLLNYGAEVNLSEKSSGHSPLILACLNLNLRVIKLILAKNPKLTLDSEDADDKGEKMELIQYLKKKFSANPLLKGENSWEEIRDVLEDYVKNNPNRQ